VRAMTSPDLRAKKPSAAIRIMLAAANESSFKRLRIYALADANLRASARGVRTVRTVRARREKLPKRLRNRGGAPCDTVLALSCPTTRPQHLPPKPPTNPLTTTRFSTPRSIIPHSAPPIHLRPLLDPALVRLENALLRQLLPLPEIAVARHKLLEHLDRDLPFLHLRGLTHEDHVSIKDLLGRRRHGTCHG
jgi:hypothetical protein